MTAVHLVDALYSRILVPGVRALLPGVAPVLRLVRPRMYGWWMEQRHTVADFEPLHKHVGQRCWIHAASVGELEQLLPIVRHLKEYRSDLEVVATVTSISAIQHARHCAELDAAGLLPLDHLPTMRQLVTTLRPSVVVINRYDLWRSLIRALHESNIPIVLVNATAPSHHRVPVIGPWLCDTYQRLTEILTITSHQAEAFREVAPTVPMSVVADSRVDQVLFRTRHRPIRPEVESWFGDATIPTLIVGSSWPNDLDLIFTALQGLTHQPRLVIVPHQLREPDIISACSKFNALRYSQDSPSSHRNVVIDTHGLLVDVYAYGTAAWVGGGFGAGVHSTTEPACAQLPIACGPNITRSEDARSLHAAGALTVIHNVDDARAWLQSHVHPTVHTTSTPHPAVTAWLESRQGASLIAARHVLQYL